MLRYIPALVSLGVVVLIVMHIWHTSQTWFGHDWKPKRKRKW